MDNNLNLCFHLAPSEGIWCRASGRPTDAAARRDNAEHESGRGIAENSRHGEGDRQPQAYQSRGGTDRQGEGGEREATSVQ